MKIRRAYKFRLYPTKEQSAALRQQGGNTRFLWNALLKQNQDKYESEISNKLNRLIKIPGEFIDCVSIEMQLLEFIMIFSIY